MSFQARSGSAANMASHFVGVAKWALNSSGRSSAKTKALSVPSASMRHWGPKKEQSARSNRIQSSGPSIAENSSKMTSDRQASTGMSCRAFSGSSWSSPYQLSGESRGTLPSGSSRNSSKISGASSFSHGQRDE